MGLVFPGVEQEYAHNRNEINAFAAEPVFREIPGELVQGRRDAELPALVGFGCGAVTWVFRRRAV